jgi:O-antigen/teichoic acid export membrane protein
MAQQTDHALSWNAAVQFAGKILTTLLGFLSIALLTRELGPMQFGWYVSAVTVLQFVAIIADFGMIPLSAQLFSQAQTPEELQKSWSTVFGFRLTTAALLLLPAPLLSYFFPYNTSVHAAAWILSASFFAIAISQVCIGFLQYKLALSAHALADTLGRLAVVVGVLLGMYYDWPFLLLVSCMSIGAIITALLLLISVSKHVRIRPKIDLREWQNIAVAMWPIAVAIMFNVLYLKGDTLILSWYAPEDQVGLYGGAYRVIDILTQTAMMLMGMMLPLLSTAWRKQDSAAFAGFHHRAWTLIALFLFPSVAGGIVLAAPIMGLVGGPSFVPAAQTLTILLLAVLGVGLSAIYGHMAVALSRQKHTLPIYIGSAIISLAGFFLFIPHFGATGAAWMTVLSEWITGIGLCVAILHYSKATFPLWHLAHIASAAMLMALCVWPIRHGHILISVLLGATIYTTLLFLMRVTSFSQLRSLFSTPAQASITETHNS